MAGIGGEGSGKELNNFLFQVDQVDAIVKGLMSTDPDVRQNAISQADTILKAEAEEKQKGFSKTMITPATTQAPRGMAGDSSNVSAEEFMKSVEEDAEARAKLRKENEKMAQELKAKGNEAFKSGSYKQAVEWYSQGMDKAKHIKELYTNRAQAFIKLKQFDDAIEDCKWALRIDGKFTKAFITQGRALVEKQSFDEALQCYNDALKIDPKQGKVINGYIKSAESAKKKSQEEKEAQDLCSEDNEQTQDLLSLLKRLSGEDPTISITQQAQAAKQYCNLTKTNAHKVLFRTNGGFSIVQSNPIFIKWWSNHHPSNKIEEMDLFCQLLNILTNVCRDNDHNVSEFLKDNHNSSFSCLLSDRTPTVVQGGIIRLLYQLSQTENGRRLIIVHKDSKQVVQKLFSSVKTGPDVATVAMGTINNFALDKGFCEQFKGNINQDMLDAFLMLMHQVCDSQTSEVVWSILPKTLSTMGNLAFDKDIRKTLTSYTHCWEAIIKLLNKYSDRTDEAQVKEMLYSLLGLLVNIMSEPSDNAKLYAEKLFPKLKKLCYDKHTDIVERSIAVLRHVLAFSDGCLQQACEEQMYSRFFDLVKQCDGYTRHDVLKCLALCTSSHQPARDCIINQNGVPALAALLKCDHKMTVGNAALCLCHCAKNKEVCESLVGTDIVELLLRHATNDDLRNDIKQNTAILLSILATSHHSHLEKLRELHGLEILHSVMKANNLV